MNLALLDTLYSLAMLMYLFSGYKVVTSSLALVRERQQLLPILALSALLVLCQYVP
jgi:hypothetical protein